MKSLIIENQSKFKFIVLTIIFCAVLYYQENLALKEENNLLKIIKLAKNAKFYLYENEVDKKVRKKWIVINTEKGVNITKNVHQNNLKNFFILNMNDVIYEDGQVIILDNDLVKLLDFNLSKNAQYNQKNIGYLLAIKNGAEFIYDAEDWVKFDLEKYFTYEKNDTGLIYDCNVTRRVINPLAHFGQPLLTQRGNPLDKDVYINNYFVGNRKTGAVQHAILNGRPDLREAQEDVKFDDTAPNFQLPTGKMAPFNSRHTLYSYNSFWALYLPSTVSSSQSDIVRSYWSQRLMWLIDERVTFIGPKGNSYKGLSMSKNEEKFDTQIKSLIDLLYSWKCEKHSFYECVVDLSKEMAKIGVWKNEEVEYIKDWLHDLNKLGYKQPNMAKLNDTCAIYINDKETYSKVRFTPLIQRSLKDKSDEKTADLNYLKDYCGPSYDIQNQSHFLSSSYEFKRNITLLVTFNLRIFEQNIPTLIHMYRSFFRNIAFCGANLVKIFDELRGRDRELFDSYTFIEFDSDNGFYHYHCMSKAAQMNYNTDGVLLASDDVVFKTWNMKSVNSSRIWYSQKLEPNAETHEKGLYSYWYWWETNYPRLQKLFNYTQMILSGPTNEWTLKEIAHIKEYINCLEVHRTKKFVAVGGSDWFYLPRHKFEIFPTISRLFRKHVIFLEIAVPTILIGLDDDKQPEILNGIYRWHAPFDFLAEYSNVMHFAHPFKLSGMKNNPRFCKLYIQDKISNNV